MRSRCFLSLWFLLFLRGSSAQSFCAPAGSSLVLRSICQLPSGSVFYSMSWIHRFNNTEAIADPSQDSRYEYGESPFHGCLLTIRGLKETDSGTYYVVLSYITVYGLETIKTPSATPLHVSDLQVSVDSDHVTEGQNVTLTCRTGCPPTVSKRFVWFKNGVRLDGRHSGDELRVSAVSREDSGRYSCAMEDFETVRSAETLLGVNRPQERAAIVTLWPLLVLTALLVLCAALWITWKRRRRSLRRPEEKEKNTENDPACARDSTLATTFDPEEKGKSVHQEEVQYSRVYFSAFTNAQSSATPAQEADVQYAEIAVRTPAERHSSRH